MSDYVDVWQMNNTFGNLQVEEGTFHEYTSSQNGRTNREGEKYVEIIEEPLTDGYRFRYENERRNAGPIKGAKSEDGHPTHPTIKIHGHRGPAYIIVSLITIHGQYPHPHKLVGEDCKDGIFRKLIEVSEMPYCFTDLRIQCVKKNQVEESLKERERRRIDPFGTGFSHSSNVNKINLNAVRLCFQVLLPGSNGNFQYPVPLKPAKSKPIYDSKSASNMSIMKLSHCSASVEGNQEIILLCGQVDKDDIEIKFYEEKDNEIIWTGYGEFKPHDVHYKVAISFRTPAYTIQSVRRTIKCFIYLRRKSDGTIGRPREFTFINKDPQGIPSKRPKFPHSGSHEDFQSKNICSPKPDVINLRVKKDAFEIRRNNGKIHCTPRTIQTTAKKAEKVAVHNNGTVNKFNVRCNPGSTFNPLPSTSALANESYAQNVPLVCDNPEKHASAMSQDQFVGASALGKDSYAQNGPLVSDNPEKHASAMSQDQFVGASSLGLPLNTQQFGDHVYPPDFENIPPNKAIAFGDPRENDKLKMLSKDVDPNPNYSNENVSSNHLNSDDVFNGFTDLFDFLYGLSVDEQIENNLGVLPNSGTADSTNDEQMSFQNNVGVLQDNDAEDSADDFLDRLSSLSLEPNSEDPDVTMRDAANNSFSEAVGISILVSS